MKNRKGFTLIEVLIVVIIIAILAALILPRFLSQPEKALIAEAQMQLGALRRAQQSYADLSGTGQYVAITASSSTNWDVLGLSYPASDKFTYSCSVAGLNCTATRASGQYATGSIRLNDNGTYVCSGTGYKAVGGNAANASQDRGCTV